MKQIWMLIILLSLEHTAISMEGTTALNANEIFSFMALIPQRNIFEIKKLVEENPEYLKCVDPMFGMNALIRSAHDGNIELIYYFYNKGIPVNSQDRLGFTALHRAVIYEKENSVNRLLELGASADLPNSDGITPRMLAMKRNNPKIVDLIK